jgi:hypothetical protein
MLFTSVGATRNGMSATTMAIARSFSASFRSNFVFPLGIYPKRSYRCLALLLVKMFLKWLAIVDLLAVGLNEPLSLCGGFTIPCVAAGFAGSVS